MTPNPKRTRALQLLANTGMWRSNYEPPALRLFWRLGIDVPPPHFARFGSIALLAGTWFGVMWGGFMWLMMWSSAGMSVAAAALAATVAGILFGLSMAGYYAYGRQKYKLPTWAALGESSAVK